MRGNKQKRRRVILVDGIRYYDDKPESCRRCFFWKNRKAGCILEERNCYYLAESVKSEQERMRGMLLCENAALCQRLLLQGAGQVATGKQRNAQGEGRGAK